MKKFLLCGLLAVSSLSYADLQVLDNVALGEINAQAGADISLNLVLNQVGGTGTDKYNYNCTPIEFCRIGIALNNRKTTDGKKQWLVFKGVQGTVTIPNMQLDVVDLTYLSKANVTVLKPAIQLSFNASTPILIRNLGFQSLSIETDDDAAGTNPGYLAKTSGGTGAGTYAAGVYNSTLSEGNFDRGREVGFIGMTMNGNLALQGKIQIFSCDSTHPRC